jgi:hypothetical protein
MFGTFGMPELIIIVVLLLMSLIWIWPLWRIIDKTGNPGPMCLLFLIPIVNLVMLFYLAFSEWPIEKELRRLRPQA